jgi:hypothetical protein
VETNGERFAAMLSAASVSTSDEDPATLALIGIGWALLEMATALRRQQPTPMSRAHEQTPALTGYQEVITLTPTLPSGGAPSLRALTEAPG